MMQNRIMAVITFMTVVLMMAWAVPALAEEVESMDNQIVNINTATRDELITLDGIGETYADRIIEYRKQNGPFQTPEDILKVKGIGEKTFETIKDQIIVKDQKKDK